MNLLLINNKVTMMWPWSDTRKDTLEVEGCTSSLLTAATGIGKENSY